MSRIDYHSDASAARRLPAASYVARFLLKLITLSLLAVISIPLWPLYWLGTLIWYRPPNVPHAAQVIRYLRLTWTVRPPAPGLSLVVRCWLTLTIIQKVIASPIVGLAWLLDELLYGRALKTTPVVAPLLVISAGRSGSTQITRYLEEDPELVGPNLLQSMFPYLWLWRLAPRTIGRFLTPDKVREKVLAMAPPELLERHEADPFRIDTFDGALYTAHLNHMALHLGPDVAVEDFGFASIAPHNRHLWENDFVQIVDRIGRKTLLYSGPDSNGRPRRLFIKGHFLAAADALEQQYPDARFLTVIREPAARLQSGVNYMRVNPTHPVLGPVPWAWLAAALVRTETRYCEVEQQWFTRTSGARRCVIRFSEFVEDLETAMQRVYRCCFDTTELPPHVPRTHPPRDRKNYSVNRSLDELGIDANEIRAQLASYVAWCQGEPHLMGQ